MSKQKAIGDTCKLFRRSISRSGSRWIGALGVLLAIVMSLILGLEFLAPIAYADIAPPLGRRVAPPLPPPNPAALEALKGDDHYLGRGVGKDYEEALKWYRKAADQGNAAAQYNLG